MSNKIKESVAYHVFLYREELRYRKVHALKLSKVKYQLTNDLVVTTWKNMKSYNKEERNHLINSMIYKKKLKQRIVKKFKIQNSS